MISVFLNEKSCIGCGRCMDIAPEAFKISGPTSSFIYQEDNIGNTAEGVKAKIKMVVLCCPSRAIDLRT